MKALNFTDVIWRIIEILDTGFFIRVELGRNSYLKYLSFYDGERTPEKFSIPIQSQLMADPRVDLDNENYQDMDGNELATDDKDEDHDEAQTN